MAFWNGDGAVSLKVNGENCGSLQPDGVKTVIWRGVSLRGGDNEIEVSAGGMSRRAHWNRAAPRRDDDQKTVSHFSQSM
jgi:hypothetical protein